MSGLSYICEYSDEEDTQLEENDYKDCKDKKDCLKPRLPPPNLSKISVVPTEEHFDEKHQHGGRIRSFPHVRGNWATFVYIEYPDQENLSIIINKFASLILKIDDSCSKCDTTHISLSKTFVLKYHMIKTFTDSLKEVLDNTESFDLGFESVEVYCNEDNTRTFIALKADFFASRYLRNISNKIDKVLEDFKLPKFYHDPSFHMSILSVNGNKKQNILNIFTQLNEIFIHEKVRAIENIIIDKVKCKSGNKFYQYYLQ